MSVMKRVFLVGIAVGFLSTAVGVKVGDAQFSPDPLPTTTLPESAVGTCRIEGVSPASDELGTIVGVDVFLRCAETTAHTSLHQLHLGADTWTAELGQLLPLIADPPDDVVTPQ